MKDWLRPIVRRTTQAAASAVIAWAPVQAVIEALGFEHVTGFQVAAVVTPAVMAGYGRLGDWLQKHPVVLRHAPLRMLVALLMGGGTPPSYDPAG